MSLLLEKEVVGPLAVNSWIVADEAEGCALLIDPGGDLDAIERRLSARSLRLEAIVATHGHIDHLAGADEACRRFCAPLWMHADEAEVLKTLPLQASLFGFPKTPTPQVSRWLREGDLVQVGDLSGRVLSTPGHTPGGLCLFFEASRALFTGDTLFSGSIGRTDLPGGDARALERSIRDRLYALPRGVTFHPGHGPSGHLDFERSANPFVREDAP